jgi:DNA primase
VTRLDKPFFPDDGISELHVFLSSLSALDQPGQLVFDLDPPDVAHFEEACRHALDLRELLEGELGLTAYVRRPGGRGFTCTCRCARTTTSIPCAASRVRSPG